MLSDYRITGFEKPVSALPDVPQISAQELKAWFDSNSVNELKDSVNGIIDALTADTGASEIGCGEERSIADAVDAAGEVLDAHTQAIDAQQQALSGKVDKVSGKGLSTEDYTTEEKEKLASLDASAQHTHANKSVLDQTTAAYTTEEKEKLASLDAASSHTHANKSVLDQISAAYTTEEKEKLASLDAASSHTHANKSVLDQISAAYTTEEKNKLSGIDEGANYFADAPADGRQYARQNGAWVQAAAGSGLPTVDYSDLDNLNSWDDAGVYAVTESTYTDASTSYEVRQYLLCVGTQYNADVDGHYVHQTLYDGYRIVERVFQDYVLSGGEIVSIQMWSDWQNAGTPENSIIWLGQLSGPQTLITNRVYRAIKKAGSASTQLTFAAPEDTTLLNQILVYYTSEIDGGITWDSNVLFVDGQQPTFTAGRYYRIIAEYDPNAQKWCVGVIS